MPLDKFTVTYLMEDPSNLEAFLYSKVLFKFSRDDRMTLLKELEESTLSIEKKFYFQYLNFAFSRADWLYDASKKLLENCSIESMLSYFEFSLNRMIYKTTDIDGVSYPEDIICSKHNFLKSVVPTALFIAKREKLPIESRKLLIDNNKSKLLLLIMAQYHSIKRQITEVMKGTYLPKPIGHIDNKYGKNSSKQFSSKCKYFLQRVPENLDSIEIYRDLNYGLLYIQEGEIEESFLTLKEAGVIKEWEEGKRIHFDMSKTKEFEEVREIKKISELIASIYGSVNSEVTYGSIKFTIQDMIILVKKIIRLSKEISGHRQKHCKHIRVYKQKFSHLSSQLKLNNLEKEIFPLFSLDLTSDNISNIENLPFFNIGNTYYMFAPITVELCYEKVLDKILSTNGVHIRLPGKEKGLVFENRINNLFVESGFEVGHIKRDGPKNIPEIDALINFDDKNILVIEAKCTIKPEERSEVFSFVENHLSKAVHQLKERVYFLRENPLEANERINFSIERKNIIPILVTNHSFFTGQTFIVEDGLLIHCIDEILLRKIISQSCITSWTYAGLGNTYIPNDKFLRTKIEKLEAITNPVANLLSKAHRTIQELGYGAAVEIYKQPHIDRFSHYR